ncbi:flagellar biosynthetic protein FliQ [[Clostridium] colinum]|uniref:flagellar biosynthetic protein FliQ n=1 Tax=[Clostridium] colinum TaxID=36835 RepID=UPI002023C02A|nr:flagellar biosynthetic protein FliQ [[Clostridium] colinum]
MSEDTVINIMQMAIKTVIFASAPPLLLGLIVGIVVSIIQTITSINEQTLALIPKILAVFLSLIIFGPFIINSIKELFLALYVDLVRFIR